MIDSRDTNLLHPTLKRGAIELSRRLKEKGYAMGISSTYRDIEAQNALYAKGRTSAGSIVTNAKGGQSIHNYKLAFDVFNNQQGNLYSATFMNLSGKIWQEMGGEWGGSWASFPDKPHMQFTNGLTLSQLQSGKTMPDNTKMKWEVDEVVTKTKIKINGTAKEVDSINKDGYNYIKLRDLESPSITIGYDDANKIALITTK